MGDAVMNAAGVLCPVSQPLRGFRGRGVAQAPAPTHLTYIRDIIGESQNALGYISLERFIYPVQVGTNKRYPDLGAQLAEQRHLREARVKGEVCPRPRAAGS
ncbi:hypothetical protein GCM10023087_12750 [Microbacterium rhizosphaerae]